MSFKINPNPELFDILDIDFATRLEALGHILSNGDMYELTYTGSNATSIV